MANCSSILASKNPMNSMKGKKIQCQNMSLPGQVVSNMLLGESREIALERTKRLSQSAKDAQLWMCLVVKLKANAVKNKIA